ncbi:VOC family protein [Agromyces allii]|uniref:Glyoxalase n=1 Tax=Agromyces allii TaxID=393607 RepID=A0ABN2R5B6_9MICO|nr:glyoxalase [Agromyces allii]
MNTEATTTTIDHLVVETDDTERARAFYAAAFDLGDRIRVRRSEAPTSGFRGFTISLLASQPANVHALYDSAIAAGATAVKPVSKSLWGVGGTFRAPDGSVWTIATSSKKDTTPAEREIDSIVLLLGPADVGAAKRFYTERGLRAGKSFGAYVEFELPGSPVQFGLNARKALAKAAGVPLDGDGSHRLAIGGGAAAFSDLDGFAWEPAADATSVAPVSPVE